VQLQPLTCWCDAANGEQHISYALPTELKSCQAATATIDLQAIDTSRGVLLSVLHQSLCCAKHYLLQPCSLSILFCYFVLCCICHQSCWIVDVKCLLSDGLKAARALHGYATTQVVHQMIRLGINSDEGPWTVEEAAAANCSMEARVDPFIFGSGASLGRASQLMNKQV